MKYCVCVFLLIAITFNINLSLAAPKIKDDNQDPNIQEFRASYVQRMKSFMNTSVDPCDDFYAYACGNYPNIIEDIELVQKQNGIYDLKNSLDAIIDEILQKPRHKLQGGLLYYNELQKVKQYVEVCDRADLFPPKPSEEYLRLIKDIGGFPAVDPTWNASAFDWFNMTAHLVRYGVVGLIKEEVFMAYPFRPMYEIGKFGFGFDVYSENIETDQSLGYVHNVGMMNRMLKIYGVDGTEADKVIDEIIEFWREAVVFQKKANDDGCNDSSEDEEFSQWNALFEITLDMKNLSAIEITPCPCPFYFNQLSVIAQKRPKAFANYMALKFLFMMHPQVKSSKHQHHYCLTRVRSALSMVLSYYFVEEHLSSEILQDVKEMIAEIVKSFKTIIETTDWLDDSARSGVQEVLAMLQSTVGQVIDPISYTYIEETKKLQLTDNYYLNTLELTKFKVDLSKYIYLNRQLNIDPTTTGFDILEAIQPNAFYEYNLHSINILGGILYPPIYHQSLPKSAKYGGLGFIIGHEIVHSLDPRGKFPEIRGWSKNTTKAMKQNSQCFIEHHSNVTVPEMNIKLDGKESLTETVCDSGGLRGSFSTLRRLLKEMIDSKQTEEEMPGLDLSPEQTFFLAFAQVYCAKYEPRHYWSELYAGYPMDKYRVILPLQNFDEFSSVFKCPVGSFMNPERKCRMW